jgi:hypothetical protein
MTGGLGGWLLRSLVLAIDPAAVAGEEAVEQEEEEEGEDGDIGRLHGFPVLGVND